MNLKTRPGQNEHSCEMIFLSLAGVTDSPVQANQEVRIATAIFPTLSLLNHSCCPNTSLVFSTGTAVKVTDPDVREDRSSVSKGVMVAVRAAKDITAGQEILHCYGEPNSIPTHVAAECVTALLLLRFFAQVPIARGWLLKSGSAFWWISTTSCVSVRPAVCQSRRRMRTVEREKGSGRVCCVASAKDLSK